jgi:TonB family protein
MRLSVASSALAAAFVLTLGAAGYEPALCQDFSITNQVEPATPWQGNVMRQLQAWWNAHAYYPRHASNNDEGGTVKVHLVIHPDGKIWTVNLVASSGSPSLDTAGDSVFRGGSVRQSLTAGEPNAEFDISLHYVLARRHDQPEAAGYTPVASNRPFTITNDPIKSPILDTMLQRTCTGTMTLGGIPNYPIYGMHSWTEAIFFRKPDGTPWVKFYERGSPSLSPVTQEGKMVTWTGRQESYGPNPGVGSFWLQYTLWSDGDNHLSGVIGTRLVAPSGVVFNRNLAGNSVDLTCATQVLPSMTWNDFLAQSIVQSPVALSSSDPP